MAKKSRRKSLAMIVMLVVLGLLCGLYFVVTRTAPSGDADETTPVDPTVTLLVLDVETMTGLRYFSGGEELSFILEENVWYWEEDTSLHLDSTAFASMVEGLQPLTSTVTIKAPDADMLADFGLDEPVQQVTLIDGTGTHTLLIGNYNSFNGCYYAAIDTTDTVYMIDAAIAESFGPSIYEILIYDTLPAITQSKIYSVSILRDEESLTCTYYADGHPDSYTDTFKWYAADEDGAETAIATAQGNSLASAISGLNFNTCVSYDYAADGAEYGLDNPAELIIAYSTTIETTDSTTGATVSTEVDKTLTLLIGDIDEASGCYYATLPGSSLIYVLEGSALTEIFAEDAVLDLPLQIAPVNFAYVSQVTFEAGLKRLTVSIAQDADTGETVYTVGGETVEYTTLSSLFSAVQSLSAESDTAESAPDDAADSTPLLRITFAFDRGEVEQAALIVTHYNTNFDRISFMGREDQLISIRDTEDLLELIEEY
ncbi:MAG: DUF4340 domain-containing protein [Clostridia bacterium]|nr:DUF4340 domain-containing protein [Clostridia bacterium]